MVAPVAHIPMPIYMYSGCQHIIHQHDDGCCVDFVSKYVWLMEVLEKPFLVKSWELHAMPSES